MQNKTKLFVIFMAISCLITISNADIGIGISDVGTISSVTAIEEKNTAPAGYILHQNYPNPFNPITTITFYLPSKLFVSLKIFDGLGREVSTLVSKELVAGLHSNRWNAKGFASGIYFYRLQAGSFTETKKLLLLR